MLKLSEMYFMTFFSCVRKDFESTSLTLDPPQGTKSLSESELCHLKVMKVAKQLDFLQKRVDQGDADSLYKLGSSYLQGWEVAKDPEKAFSLFQKGASQGHGQCMGQLASCYLEGNGVAANPEKAFFWLKEGSLKKDGLSLYLLGYHYFVKGRNLDQGDLVTAFGYFQEAANQGYRPSMHDLGDCYAEGNGVAVNLEKAFFWFQKGADNGSSACMYKLGRCYLKGVGVAANPEKAAYWFEKGADKDNEDCFFEIARCYLNGKGVIANPEKAFFWFQKGAGQGDDRCKYSLADCYFYGKGTQRDVKKALKLFEEADTHESRVFLWRFYQEEHVIDGIKYEANQDLSGKIFSSILNNYR